MSNRTSLAIALGSGVLFAGLFVGTSQQFGALLAPVALLPVIIAAIGFGLRGGLASATVLGTFMLVYSLLTREVEDAPTGLLRAGGLVAVGGVVGRLHDLAAQVRRESEGRLAALKESEDKSRFIATMSHELRTPLNAVLGFAQLLQRPEMDNLTERQHRYVANIITGGRDLTGLVEEVLAYAKLSQAEVQRELGPVFAGDVIGKVLEASGPQAEAKGLTLRAGVHADAWVVADPVLLERALLNLVGNAIKFTAEGEVRAVARSRPGEVVIEVTDTGIGIAAEDQGRIFQPFTQVSRGTARDYGGIGLGLAITATLVETLQGRIEVSSERGRGSTFRITLPAAVPPVGQSEPDLGAGLEGVAGGR